MPVVWSDRHRLHDPGSEVWVGVRMPASEVPARADAIRAALGGDVVEASPHPDAALRAVHDPALLDYLARAWADWEAAGLPAEPGQDRVVPYVFAHPGLLGDAPAAYACIRPPGHHVTRSAYGGSCYLNNAAVAAASLAARVDGPVAVLDVDAHHGNGTQAVFYDRADVLVGSVHVDPGAGWFPHFLGFARETGAGAGAGANRNLPLDPGSGDADWVAAVEALAQWAQGAAALVVALGVDAAAGDAESPLQVSEAGFRAAGRALGALRLPTVVVQEGGYDLSSIGALVRATLTGLEEGLG